MFGRLDQLALSPTANSATGGLVFSEVSHCEADCDYHARMTPPRKPGYRNYTADGTYWTVRKYNGGYWVVRIDNSSNTYEWAEVFGGYDAAGAAGGAAAQLAYAQGRKDALEEATAALHSALDGVGLGVPKPSAPKLPPTAAPSEPVNDEVD